MSARPPLLFQRQAGDHRVASTINHARLQTLEFCHDKVIRSVHAGGVTCLDLDPGEQRYLLAGAADASIAVYDLHQPSPADVQQQQAEARQAARNAAAALDAAAPALRPSAQAEAAAAPGAGGGGRTDHAALFSITKQAPQGHRFSVSAVAWYPVDSGLFVSGGYDCEAKVWDANTLQVVCSFSLGSRVYAAAMSATATAHCLVAVGGGGSAVQLCDVVSGGFTHALAGHRAAVWALAWSPSSEWQLMTGGCDGQLRLWDIRRSGPLHIFDQHDTQQQRAQQRQQRQQQQRQDELQQERPEERQDGQQRRRQQRPGRGRREGAATGVQRQGSGGGRGGGGGDAEAAGGGSERMFLPERVTKYSTAHAGSITGIVPTPDGLRWLSAGTDDRVRLWDAATYRHELVHYPGAYNRAQRARQLAVSDDGSVLFHPSGSAVQMFDIASGRLLRTLGGAHFDTVNCCRWNAASQELYSGSNDCNIVVWAPARERVGAEREPWQQDSDGDVWSD